MGKNWKKFFGKLATVGRTAAGAAVQQYTGGLVPSTVITGKGGTQSAPTDPPATPPAPPPAADPTTAAVKAARGEFKQWPPAPDEVEPGVGGGVTSGVSRDQLGVLGELWMGCPRRPMLGMDDPTQAAVSYIAGRFGWVDVTRPVELDPDQYYTARLWLREWVEKGEEPRWPANPHQPA